jgi:hypothetical protein
MITFWRFDGWIDDIGVDFTSWIKSFYIVLLPLRVSNIKSNSKTNMATRETFNSGAKWEPIVGYSRALRLGDLIEVPALFQLMTKAIL